MTALTASSMTSNENQYISHSDEAEALRAQQLAGIEGIGDVINPHDDLTGMMLEDLGLEVDNERTRR